MAVLLLDQCAVLTFFKNKQGKECKKLSSWLLATTIVIANNNPFDFYRAMHFSAKRGIAIACRLSVCPSVRL